MLTLAFFPWLQLEEEYRFPDFQILSYQRGSFPGSTPSEQKAIDDALSSYHARTGRPLDRASILQHRSQSTPTAELNTAYRADLVVYADLIAFAGLSARTFFNPLCYSNRDAFRLVVQDIPESARNLLITSRRRDGETNLCYMDGSYIARPPEHVMQDHAPLDPTVLVALLEAQAHDDWPELFRAIALFNEANTDRAEIPIATEVILTYAALEQALGVAGKPVNKVAMAFENEFKPSEPLPNKDWFDPQRDWFNRRQKQQVCKRLHNSSSLRAAWLVDLGNSRGSLAHGNAPESYPPLWLPEDHLLFGAHVIPLLIKQRLHRAGFYQMTREDKAGIEAFERLLNARPLELHSVERDPSEHPWLEILSEHHLRLLVAEATATREETGTYPH